VNVSDRAAGSTLEGRYRLEARLSNWGVGEVWRAADAQRPRTTVTVKLLPAPTTRRAERMGALKVLGDRLARLQHPGVLPVVEVNTAGAQPFVVYEAWEGVGLGEWLTAARATAEPTPLRAVAAIADRVLAAVGAGHRQRAPGSLVHGAVHHDAVRVRVAEGREPEVRVIDFGLSAEKESSALAALVDTNPSEYAAPEHAREPALRNPAADVFALAVLVLRMLVPEAVRPRGHRSWAHFVTQREGEVHSAITALRADVHPTVWEALAQALSRRPEARPADAERLREMLRGAAWGSAAVNVDDGLAPVVPMALPTLQPVAPPVAAPLPLPPVYAPPSAPAPPSFRPPTSQAPAFVPTAPPPPPAPAGPPVGPPPVPKGMQLGVGSVLGANRPGGASTRPRRATMDADHRNFGPLAPIAPDVAPRAGLVSLDDAQATRQDFGAALDTEPPTYASVDGPTMAHNIPSASHRLPSRRPDLKATLDQAQRTEQSPFDAAENTRIAQLPVPVAAPVPTRGGSAKWQAGPQAPFEATAVHHFAPAPPLTDATVPISLDAVPPAVAAALAAYAAPVNPASWDSTSNLQPVSFPSQAPRPAQFAPPAYAPPSAPGAADPFAMVAASGRGDARAWDAHTAPPDRPQTAARRPSNALLVALALLAAGVAFLLGVLAFNRRPEAPAAVAPAAR
jgi:serine/threonine protein kinase